MKSWADRYLLNILKIDEQHRGFFELLDEELLRTKVLNQEHTLKLINKLEEYLKDHFVAEEELLVNANYPDIKKHKEQHLFFIQKVEEMKLELLYNNQIINIKLIDFMKKWFLAHILHFDKQYKETVKSYLETKTNE
ncbi:MAG: hemerythrin family protein [Bacteroidales bacterium]|nr:hemerythrin family protein [Bacteroidales bacterium]MBN2750523.1 hemerythrin family protein [Bacteroidales bacterium]